MHVQPNAWCVWAPGREGKTWRKGRLYRREGGGGEYSIHTSTCCCSFKHLLVLQLNRLVYFFDSLFVFVSTNIHPKMSSPSFIECKESALFITTYRYTPGEFTPQARTLASINRALTKRATVMSRWHLTNGTQCDQNNEVMELNTTYSCKHSCCKGQVETLAVKASKTRISKPTPPLTKPSTLNYKL